MINSLLLGNPAKAADSKLFFCKVTRFYAASNTVDVVTIDNDTALLGCQIACSLPVGFSFGQRYIPSHDDTSAETGHIMSPGDIYCIAAYLNGDYYNSAVIGFLFPKESTLSIPDYGLYIFRHESDVIYFIRGDGTTQIYHPSGSIIKMGSDDSDETINLIPTKIASSYIRNADEYNKSKDSNLFIRWYAGQKVTINSDGEIILQTKDAAATITMTSDGVVTINTSKEVNVATKDVNVEASGDVNVEASGDVNVNADGDANVVADQVNVDTQRLNLTVPVGEMKINGYTGKTGVGHEHSGNPQFYVVNGIEINGTYP